MSVVTVVGASGAIVPVTVNGAAALSLAQFYAASINGLAFTGGLSTTILTAGTAPGAIPAGQTGQGVITTPGSYSFPSGYSYVTDVAAGPVTIIEGRETASTSVLASNGGTTLYGGNGGGLFVAGGGNNLFDGGGTGSYAIGTGNGNSSVYGGRGNDLIQDGVGRNQIFTGSGNDTVLSYGSDLIVTGTGSNIVTLLGSGSTVSGGPGALLLIDAGRGNVFLGESGSTVLFGGTSGSYFLSGNSTVVGGSNDTISASGNITVFGGLNTAVFENGTGSLAFIARSNSAATVGGGGVSESVFGASGADITYLSASGVSYLVASNGNETLNGSFSTGPLELFGSKGNASLVGGAGADTLAAGTGNDTLAGGHGSANLFIFSNGQAGGNTTISDFGSAAGNLVGLFGYGANEVQSALATASSTNTGGSVVKLSDNTTITFSTLSVDQLKAHGSQFFSG